MSGKVRVGQAIRNLRRSRNMTAAELGKRVGLSQPRISKIETGVDPSPKAADIAAMLDALEAPQAIRQQVMGALGRQNRTAFRRYKARYTFMKPLEQERKSSMVRFFCMSMIPALLQTIEYRESLLKHLSLADDVAALAMTTVAQRQELCWDVHRRYHFVLYEAALYTAPGSQAAQRRQLDRIELFIDSRHIKLGIIPFECGLPPGVESGPFVIYDDRLLAISLVGSTLDSREQEDIAEHLKVFSALDRMADYGDSARALVRKATNYFS